MLEALKAMLSSKKFIATLVALIVQIGGRYGLQLDQEAVMIIMAPLLAYILAQGFADHGSTAAKINSSTTTTTTVAPTTGAQPGVMVESTSATAPEVKP